MFSYRKYTTSFQTQHSILHSMITLNWYISKPYWCECGEGIVVFSWWTIWTVASSMYKNGSSVWVCEHKMFLCTHFVLFWNYLYDPGLKFMLSPFSFVCGIRKSMGQCHYYISCYGNPWDSVTITLVAMEIHGTVSLLLTNRFEMSFAVPLVTLGTRHPSEFLWPACITYVDCPFFHYFNMECPSLRSLTPVLRNAIVFFSFD